MQVLPVLVHPGIAVAHAPSASRLAFLKIFISLIYVQHWMMSLCSAVVHALPMLGWYRPMLMGQHVLLQAELSAERRTRQTRVVEITVTSKICRQCAEKKHVSAFNRNKNNPDGLASYCKPCRSQNEAGARVRVDSALARLWTQAHAAATDSLVHA